MKRFFAVSFAVLIVGGSLNTTYAKSEFLVEQEDYEVIEGVKYTDSHLNEFLWGLSRPFHLYNTKYDGMKEPLPFYLQPMREGGMFGYLNPDAWRTDSSLTFGALAAEMLILLLIL